MRLLKLFICVASVSFVFMSYMAWMFYAVQSYHALVTLVMVSFFVAAAVVFSLWCERK